MTIALFALILCCLVTGGIVTLVGVALYLTRATNNRTRWFR